MLQTFVKFYDGRFTDVYPMEDKTYVTIEFANGENFIDFLLRWKTFTTDIVEIQQPTGMKKFLRRLRGEIKHLQDLFRKIQD